MADYINREALLKMIGTMPSSPITDREERLIRAFISTVKNFPAADVWPVVKAKWEDVHIKRPEIADLEVASMFCPNCNRWHNEVYNYGNPTEMAHFCPNCGAKMEVQDGTD